MDSFLGRPNCLPKDMYAFPEMYALSKDTFVRLSHKTDSNIGTHICVPFPILKQRSMNNVANFAEIIYGSSQTRPAGRDLVEPAKNRAPRTRFKKRGL